MPRVSLPADSEGLREPLARLGAAVRRTLPPPWQSLTPALAGLPGPWLAASAAVGAGGHALPGPQGASSSSSGPAGSDVAPTTPPASADVAVPEGSHEVATLVADAQAGSADAFGHLYDRYVDVVYRYISFRVSSRALTEDLTSEVFLRALKRIGAFQWQGRDFGAWLVTIARNLVADHYKSGRARLEVTTDDVAAGRPHPTAESPESLVLDLLRDQALLDAVARLPSEQQECVSLRFLQGLSVTETALVLGKGEGAVKAMQYRAVRALGRLLAGEAR